MRGRLADVDFEALKGLSNDPEDRMAVEYMKALKAINPDMSENELDWRVGIAKQGGFTIH